ncbi:MAG: 30S ribosomal protein S6 [Alphaproteobacteria bacterium]|jgi:small subunit ribosomal protein S6|nr:30S ribosomal protein S6 [Alphaproteobacteria bacterium]MDG1882393.1 30S ribosomal protein S6 [Alphaproteobacteria bacterium]|tara:strand:+ start:682 stop:1068 length:387 start_codon:yes stop_codon:yes gene_type:complete
MALYESVIIGRQDLTNSQFETLIDEFTSVIKSHDGEIKKTEYWGIRNLAYKINKNRKAHYYMLNISSSPETISEYERLLGLHEDIIRFLTIKIDKVDENPSLLMNNKVDRHRNESASDNIEIASKANV